MSLSRSVASQGARSTRNATRVASSRGRNTTQPNQPSSSLQSSESDFQAMLQNRLLQLLRPQISRAMSTTSSTQADASSTTLDANQKPLTRAEKRKLFFERRLIHRDHVVRAHHFDLRIAAIRFTDTVNDAVNRHEMSELEAQLWAPLAAGTALHASMLRGDERVQSKMLIRPWDEREKMDVVCAEGMFSLPIKSFHHVMYWLVLNSKDTTKSTRFVIPCFIPIYLTPIPFHVFFSVSRYCCW